METEADNWTGFLDGLECQPLQGEPESFFAVAEEMRRFLRKRSHSPMAGDSPLSASLPSSLKATWSSEAEEDDDGYCPSDGVDFVAIRRYKRSRKSMRSRSVRLHKRPRPGKDLYAFKDTDSGSYVSSPSSSSSVDSSESSEASSDSESDDSGRSSPRHYRSTETIASVARRPINRPRTLPLFRSARDSSCSPSSSFCCSSSSSSFSSHELGSDEFPGPPLDNLLPDIPSPTPPANDTHAPLAGSAHRCLRFRSSLQTMAGHPGACASEEWLGSELDLPTDLPRSPAISMRKTESNGQNHARGPTISGRLTGASASLTERPRNLPLHRKFTGTPHYPHRPALPSLSSHSEGRPRHAFAPVRHHHSSATSASSSSSSSVHIEPSQGLSWLTDGDSNDQSPLLWRFLLELLESSRANPSLVRWEDRQTLKFRLVDSQKVSQLWGERKKKRGMTYESLGRSLRYYYTKGVLEKVDGARLCYRFVEDHLRRKGIVLKRHDSSSSR